MSFCLRVRLDSRIPVLGFISLFKFEANSTWVRTRMRMRLSTINIIFKLVDESLGSSKVFRFVSNSGTGAGSSHSGLVPSSEFPLLSPVGFASNDGRAIRLRLRGVRDTFRLRVAYRFVSYVNGGTASDRMWMALGAGLRDD